MLALLARISKLLLRSDASQYDGSLAVMESTRGNALRSARKALRLTQQQVAEKIGVTRAAVGQWENDESISFSNFKAVCAALGIDMLAAAEGEFVKISEENEYKSATNLFSVEKPMEKGRSDPELYSENYFVEKGIIPVYLLTEKGQFQTDGNAQISETPVLNAERTDRTPKDNNLYLVSQITSVMEPDFQSGHGFSASSEGTPSVGNYVLVNLKSDRAFEPGKRPSGIPLMPCYFGILVSYTGSGIVVMQLNPEERFVVPLNSVASIHTAWPHDPR